MIKKLLLLCIFFLGACQLTGKKRSTPDLTPLQTLNMNKALELVQAGEFLKAAAIYDGLAKELRNKPSEVVFLFNSGSSYREGGNCSSAVQRYRHLLDRSLNEPLFKTRGLLEISYSYECLGDIKAAYLSLADINSLRNHLPKEIQIAVYPARLSIAHAYFQQFSKADGYESLALNGILQLKMKYSSEEEIKKNLSRVFYNMGRVYFKKKHLKPKAFLSAFPYHQLYLLQSIFLQDPFWSAKSRTALTTAFEMLEQALQEKKVRSQYKDYILLSLKEGRLLVKKENNAELKSFYLKLFQKIRPFL